MQSTVRLLALLAPSSLWIWLRCAPGRQFSHQCTVFLATLRIVRPFVRRRPVNHIASTTLGCVYDFADGCTRSASVMAHVTANAPLLCRRRSTQRSSTSPSEMVAPAVDRCLRWRVTAQLCKSLRAPPALTTRRPLSTSLAKSSWPPCPRICLGAFSTAPESPLTGAHRSLPRLSWTFRDRPSTRASGRTPRR